MYGISIIYYMIYLKALESKGPMGNEMSFT